MIIDNICLTLIVALKRIVLYLTYKNYLFKFNQLTWTMSATLIRITNKKLG